MAPPLTLRAAALLAAAAALLAEATTTAPRAVECVGQFAPCARPSQACSMNATRCAGCKAGQYVCPSDQKTCVDGPAGYARCPGLAGTHLDHTLPLEQRIDYILNHTTLDEQIAQLQTRAPAITHLGIPSYNWLNDDVHGVGRAGIKATILPDGCGLGATWSRKLLLAAGRVLGEEARAAQRWFLDNSDDRGASINGAGLTIYGPNLNLVRDPRWGRGQETFGECPQLTGDLVISWVTGAQSNAPTEAVGPDGLLLSGLCCKHFAAYDQEETFSVDGKYHDDKSYFSANVTSRSMWETYMPAFQKCVVTGRASHVMCSYNR